ncbi:RNA polymerase sigma factor [Planococcus sp. CAU13]|uniref:RNA polymerase sigma factor n=1 Tax=Planococcus sp. CAU13 TaxID=1541197 RepID=UPI00052FF919|nr:sigma-70 region 4 domain-containing protein [Planococcus sp. CAU13]
MTNEDLLNGAKSGNREALIAWSRVHIPMIFRLAYQAGLPKEKFGRFHLEILQQISNSLETLDDGNAESRLMEAAVDILKTGSLELAFNADDGSIKFEEDFQAHQALQKLTIRKKLAVILIRFHGKSIKETAALLNESEELAETAVADAMDVIGRELALVSPEDVQKRMDLLNKSYNRIALPEEDNLLIEEIQTTDPVPAAIKQKEKPPVNRRTIAVLAGASLFLAAVIGTSFVFNEQPSVTEQTAAEEENPTTVSRQMIKDWEAQYEEIRNSAPERLGISPDRFEQLEYVQKADALMERTFSRQNVKLLRDDPERMQKQVDILMWSIETPKGMMDSVKDYRLMAAEVGKFLGIYTEKTDQLMTIADALLEQYKDELSKAEMSGELSAVKLLHSKGEFPDEIENLTSSLRENTLQYMVHPNEDRFRTMRDISTFYQIHPFNTDWQSQFYLEIIGAAPYYDETGLLWPLEQVPYLIMTMSQFLTEPTSDPGLKGTVETMLTNTFYSMVKGDYETEVFEEDGVVKDEFRMAWENSLQVGSNPMTFLMLPIIEEFEESGWKKSAHFDQLALPDILYAINLERMGELAEKLPNGDLKIESVTLDLEGYDYSDIMPLYEKFEATHDVDSLSGVAPMDIIKLYHYANQMEDSETMWHLTVDDVLKPSLEEYMENWKKRPEITETLESIEIYGENIHREGRKVLLMAMGMQKSADFQYHQMQNFTLYTERDQIWLMQHQMDEFYVRDENFDEFDANVHKHYENLLQNENLAEVNDATPAEIAGAFLLAMEKEDVKTMRLLINQNNQSMEDEEFKRLWITNSHLPAYSKVGRLNFRVDSHNLNAHLIMGGIEVSDADSAMENNYYFSMEKADGFWMVSDMHSY